MSQVSEQTREPAPTLASQSEAGGEGSTAVPCLTVLYHPDLARVGQRVVLDGLFAGAQVRLSRTAPCFCAPGRTDGGAPLDDPYLSASKSALLTYQWPRGLVLSAPERARVDIRFQRVSGDRVVSPGELRQGLVLTLARRVALLLHLVEETSALAPEFGMIGHSDAIERVRRAIRQVADLDVPVLLRGESGVGKELGARAIHRASPRASGLYKPVNMAAIATGTAQAELFGHEKGAFTGAVQRGTGLFAVCDGGTLFLDEIGETPNDIQPMLLRVLETGEIQPVGTARAQRRVDVRVLSATDTDLEAAVRQGRFRGPLLHRLAGYEIRIPPLRERRDDIARLAVHLLRCELESIGEGERMQPVAADAKPWFPLRLMVDLVEYSWADGNVRALANVIRTLVISNRGRPHVVPDEHVTALLRSDRAPGPPDFDPVEEPRSGPAPAQDTPRRRRKPVHIDDDELVAAMRAHAFKPKATARALGIPESTVYDLIARSPRLRLAKDIPREELARCQADHDGDLDAMAEHLMVSRRGLKLRMNELGLL
ncbi:sigma 54-interacting transcriptional regulator [Haliangium sp.]|uniref:sigma 54-interacting transcriptional regulator n=1 Tax=Haliangium sp. TaxID=2663208 RepID=UPI003D110633